jgi:mannose-6-phosphate isomerase
LGRPQEGGLTIYPFKFKPIYQNRVWGGTNIARLLDRSVFGSRIGESWELSCHPHGVSVIANGPLAGKTLQDLIEEYPAEILGELASANKTSFPLLIKIIDANDKLSIQVHPDDTHALRAGEQTGKTEAWYVLAANEGAKIVYGLQPGIAKERFAEAVRAGRVLETLQVVPVQTGDIVLVPAGVVHALMEGVLVCEIQQNSDTTYRIFDYHRVGADGLQRELHIDQALDVMRFDAQPELDFRRDHVVCPHFAIHRIKSETQHVCRTQNQLLILYIIGGIGKLCCMGGTEMVKQGETILIPACLGEVVIKGNIEFLVVTPGQKN